MTNTKLTTHERALILIDDMNLADNWVEGLDEAVCGDGSRYLSLERQAQKLGLGVLSTSSTGIQRPWDYRRSKRSVSSSFKRKYRCKEIASWNKAQQLLREGHTYLDRDRDGEACESLR